MGLAVKLTMMATNYKESGDNHLIQLILEGDRKANGELYSRYYKKVFGKCLSFTRNTDEAFDLAQEALLKAFEKLHTFRGESSFSTWLFIITQRHCLASLKKNKKTSSLTFLDTEINTSETTANDTCHERVEQENIMFSLLHALPETERQLLTLKYKDGASIESLESLLDLSSSAIKMRLKRSKEKLNVLYSLAMTYGLDQVLNQI